MELAARFQLPTPIKVPHGQLHRVPLEPVGVQLDGVDYARGSIRFIRAGWYEVLLTVAWDPKNQDGSRFAHTSIPDQHPLHSETIEAKVLNALSGGEQLLRGNTMFEPDRVDRIELEVWQNSGSPITLRHASLDVRPLGASTGGG